MAPTNDRERQRLIHGPLPSEIPGGIGLEAFRVRCSGEAALVLDKVREVMSVVLLYDVDNWPSDDAWRQLLPAWFVQRCEASRWREEVDSRFTWWQRFLLQRRRRHARVGPWPVDAWIYWFLQEQWEWYWWHATIKSRHVWRLEVEVTDGPFPWDALYWLFRAAGATSVRHLYL